MKVVSSEHILNVWQAGYADRLVRKCEGKRGLKNDSKHFGLSK